MQETPTSHVPRTVSVTVRVNCSSGERYYGGSHLTLRDSVQSHLLLDFYTFHTYCTCCFFVSVCLFLCQIKSVQMKLLLRSHHSHSLQYWMIISLTFCKGSMRPDHSSLLWAFGIHILIYNISILSCLFHSHHWEDVTPILPSLTTKAGSIPDYNDYFLIAIIKTEHFIVITK